VPPANLSNIETHAKATGPSGQTRTAGMNRGIILDQLALALRHVAVGERHIAQQHEIIASLERKGLDTSEAKAVLLQFKELQAMHVADRDRLKKELAASK
jgi:hypothetical protein